MIPRCVLFACVLLAACRPAPAGPGNTLAAYGAAIEHGDWAAAYALMSDGYRKRVPFEAFRRRMEAGGADGRTAGKALRETGPRWGARVEVAAGDERVGLVQEDGAWRLDRPPFEPFGQATPRAALRSFIRAVELRRWDVLIDLAPGAFRSEVTADKLRRYWDDQGPERTRALLSDLRLALEGQVVEEGDEAYLGYGQGRQVRFVREEGLWRIDSPE